jgi:hypothetical protein
VKGGSKIIKIGLYFQAQKADMYYNFSQLRLGDPKGLPYFFAHSHRRWAIPLQFSIPFPLWYKHVEEGQNQNVRSHHVFRQVFVIHKLFPDSVLLCFSSPALRRSDLSGSQPNRRIYLS